MLANILCESYKIWRILNIIELWITYRKCEFTLRKVIPT
jgi:hypothetical protein